MSRYQILEIPIEKWNHWDDFALAQPTGTIFHTSMWLRHFKKIRLRIFGIYDSNDNLAGGAAVTLKEKLGISVIPQLKISPYCGPLFTYSFLQSDEADTAIGELLQKVYFSADAFRFSFPPQAEKTAKRVHQILNKLTDHSESLDFYTFRTNTLNCSKDQNPEELYTGKTLRRNIRKARAANLKSVPNPDLESIYRLSSLSFQNSGRKHPLEIEEFTNLSNELLAAGRLNTALIQTAGGTDAAAHWSPMDKHTAYHCISGIDRNLSSANAGSLAMHEIISKAVEKGKVFDFEGSSNENINRFFCSFGPSETRYFHFRYVGSTRLKLLLKSGLISF
ncbi:MAG: GNAT family N-acetyltransferase [Balneolales bacterium]|nr:GNAT family N-acetyltransferase [Balneolales bacterium]